MADIQALLSAIDVFSRAPDKTSLEKANTWLQEFQHSPEAWMTCTVLLSSSDAPPAAKLFAAQTLRTKVTYDLHQVDPQEIRALRDTLLENLARYHSGPRNIIIQLCLAISGLALQYPAWDTAVQEMIDYFGKIPAMVPTLLQFLIVLPEEISSNTRIPVTDEQYKERSGNLLSANSKQVLDLLSMYIGATGVTTAVKSEVFNCLRSWLIAGEVSTKDLAKTPLFPAVFEALGSNELFDSAVDVICELIHETQEIDENMPVIQLIVPRVVALKPVLLEHCDDAEKIRGYAKIFSEAGETYRVLLLQHTETFFPIVEAIGECSAYPDLDIVPITFPFWARLATAIGKRPSTSPVFLDAYRALMGVIINHLHFPSDETMLTGQEAENFRSFRHVMGDTLKDCCLVLKTENCLNATYEMITAALARGPDAVSWQEVEAPLFALRSMGAEVDLADQNAVPKIMDLIPQLPSHPRVRYAALLIIARYTEWINKHPDYINPQLQYIARGFEDPDSDVRAAAGHALKYLCQDCKQHLAEFLPTLHTFLNTTGANLAQDDRQQVYEAIGHVLSAMPMDRAAESLRTFSMDILAYIHSLATKSVTPTQAELHKVGEGLENLEVLLHLVRTFGEELPAACQGSCPEAWAVFDSFLTKYGSNYGLAEGAIRVLRHGLTLFSSTALSVAPAVLNKMSQGFAATGFSSYLWMAGKVVNQCGAEEDQAVRASLQELYEHSTSKLVSLLQTKAPDEIPDVLEDYVQMLLQFIEQAPDVFFQNAAFENAFKASMAALMVVHSDIVFAALELFRLIFTHDCLNPATTPKFSAYASTIRSVMDREGYAFVGCVLTGLVGDFPEESKPLVVPIVRSLTVSWREQLLVWLPSVLQQLPASKVPNEEKSRFLTDITNASNNRQYEKVKQAVHELNRAAKRARDRRQGMQTA